MTQKPAMQGSMVTDEFVSDDEDDDWSDDEDDEDDDDDDRDHMNVNLLNEPLKDISTTKLKQELLIAHDNKPSRRGKVQMNYMIQSH